MQAISHPETPLARDVSPPGAVFAAGEPAMPAQRAQTRPPGEVGALTGDLYAFVVFLHKHCNSDLFEAVGALEVSLSQLKLLHHLEATDHELTLKEAGESVHVSLPAASRMVDDLVRRGFVGRHEDADDRRMKRVSITENGRAVIRRLNAARLNGLHEFTQSLSAAERDELAGALAHILQRPDVAACRLGDPA